MIPTGESWEGNPIRNMEYNIYGKIPVSGIPVYIILMHTILKKIQECVYIPILPYRKVQYLYVLTSEEYVYIYISSCMTQYSAYMYLQK